MTLSDDLRTRIAAVLCAHPDKSDGTCCGAPGLGIEYQQDWALHVADAVIMVLIPESSTDWKADDE